MAVLERKIAIQARIFTQRWLEANTGGGREAWCGGVAGYWGGGGGRVVVVRGGEAVLAAILPSALHRMKHK